MRKKMKKLVTGLLLSITTVSISLGSVNVQAATKATATAPKVALFKRDSVSSAKLTIKRVSSAKKYQIQYAYNKGKIASGKKVTKPQKSSSKITVTIKDSGLKTHKNTYVRVRYITKKGAYSKWSKVTTLNNNTKSFTYKKTVKNVYETQTRNGQKRTVIGRCKDGSKIIKTFETDNSSKYWNEDGTLKEKKFSEKAKACGMQIGVCGYGTVLEEEVAEYLTDLLAQHIAFSFGNDGVCNFVKVKVGEKKVYVWTKK